MFRDMRRKKQQLTYEESEKILEKCTHGVLSLYGDDEYPYGVPMSYVYADGHIYFHCGKTGHKLDAVNRSPKASFTVVEQDKIVPEKFTTYYRSVIVFGRIRIIEDLQEKRKAIEKLGCKYSPNVSQDAMNDEIDKMWDALCMLEMTVEHMTGKECIELVKARGGNV